MIRYYVTDRKQGDVLASVRRAVDAGVDRIQVREKDLDAGELRKLVCQVRDIAAGSKTQVLVNGRLDIALALRIDGVHLPANGLPANLVRPYVRLLGVSTHTLEQAVEAETAGADFIVFGPVFETPGKDAVGLDCLRQIVSSVKIPVVAIGGVTPENTSQVLAAGAAGVAGIRMFQTPD